MTYWEGRGYVLRCGSDAPLRGWVSARLIDGQTPLASAPWMAIQSLSELLRIIPGGISLLWDLSPQAAELGSGELRAAFWGALGHLPGLSLHIRDAELAEHLEGPLYGWFHGAQPPEGSMGMAWRHGWIGWVPESGPVWSIPGLGQASGDSLAGFLWGELLLPLGALGELQAQDVVPLMEDAQARLERNLSLRLSAKAWPGAFPFSRRQTGWRVGLLGGREFQLAAGEWESVARKLQSFGSDLASALRCPIHMGTCHDFDVASRLGHQAMHEGLPWRSTLPLPPASPSFTPGLAADPRDPAPLELRAAFPAPLASLLGHPPTALLRVPRVPQEAAVAAFLRGFAHVPAIRWIAPEVPPPGPYLGERPWAPSSAYAPLADVTQALQPSLFELDG